MIVSIDPTDLLGNLMVILDRRLKKRISSVSNRVYDGLAPNNVKSPYIVYGLRNVTSLTPYIFAGPPPRVVEISLLDISIVIWTRSTRGVAPVMGGLSSIWNTMRNPSVAVEQQMTYSFSRLDAALVQQPEWVGYNTTFRVVAKEIV